MSLDPETLRLYASIYEKPYRDYKGGVLHPPTAAGRAAAQALRYMADQIQKGEMPDEVR